MGAEMNFTKPKCPLKSGKGKVYRVIRSVECASYTPPPTIVERSTVLLQLISQLQPLNALDINLKSDKQPASFEKKLRPHPYGEVVLAVKDDLKWEPITSEKPLRVVTTCLPNGMQVAIVESVTSLENLNEASLSFHFDVGLAMDPVDRPGLIEVTRECIVSAMKKIFPSLEEIPSVSNAPPLVTEMMTSINLRVKNPDGLKKLSQIFTDLVKDPAKYITTGMVTAVVREFHRKWKLANNNFTVVAEDHVMNDTIKNQVGFRGSSALMKKDVDRFRNLVVDTITTGFSPGLTRTVFVGGPETAKELKHAAATLVGVPVLDARPIVFVHQQPSASEDLGSLRGSLTRVMPRDMDRKQLSFRFPMGLKKLSQKDRALAWLLVKIFTDRKYGSLEADLKQQGLADRLSCRVAETGLFPELVVDMHLERANDEVLQDIGQIIYRHIGTLRETRNFQTLLGDVAEPNRRRAPLALDWNKGVSFKEVVETAAADGGVNKDEALVEISRLLECIGDSEEVRVMVVDSDYVLSEEQKDAVEEVPGLDADVLRRSPLPDEWKKLWVPLAVTPLEDVKWKEALMTKPQYMEGFAVNCLKLKNDLNLVLVSSPDSRMFAASSTVRVGHTENPVEYPGLAHLVEHVLWSGSKEFPDGLRRACSTVGGYTNAETSLYSTSYFGSAELNEADKIVASMADLLTNPLLSREIVSAELAAVDSEWELASKRRCDRNCEILLMVGNPEHVAHHHCTGNHKVLLNLDKFGGDREKALDALHAAAEKLFRTRYSANITTVVVVSRESLSDLEKMTVERFAKMPNYNVVPQQGSGQWVEKDKALYRQGKELNQLITVPSDCSPWNVLRFSWLVNDQFDKWNSRPLELLGPLLTGDQKGSISALLKEKQLVKDKTWLRPMEGFGPSLGSFEVVLNDHVDPTVELAAEIGQLLSAQLRLLVESGIPEWILDDDRNIKRNDWFFDTRSKELAIAQKSKLVGSIPWEEVFTREPTPQRDELLAEMVPFADVKNLMILRNRKVSEEELQTFQVDPISTLKYKREPLPENILEKCSAIWKMEKEDFAQFARDLGLSLPSPNRFIPTSLLVKNGGEQGEGIVPGESAPKVVPDIAVPGIKVWHKQVAFNKSPKVNFTVRFRVPSLLPDVEELRRLSSFSDFQDFLAEEKAKLAANCEFADLAPTTRLMYTGAFVAALNKSIWSDLTQAATSGLSGYWVQKNFGAHLFLALQIEGFDEKAGEMLDTLLKGWISPKVEGHHIREAISRYRMGVDRGLQKSNPFGKCVGTRHQVLGPGFLSLHEWAAMVDLLDVDSMRRFFSPEAVKKLFLGTGAEALIVGNVTEDEVRDFFNSETRSAAWNQLAPITGDMVQGRIASINLRQLKDVLFVKQEGEEVSSVKGLFIREEDPRIADENNCAVIVSLVKDYSPEAVVLLRILRDTLDIDFFEDLRSRQNLGYIVGAGTNSFGPYQLIDFYVVSRFDSTTILARILEFLKTNVYDSETNEVKLQMSEEKFQEMKKLALAEFGNKFTTVEDLTNSYQNEIDRDSLDFDHAKTQLAYLEGLTLEKLKEQVKVLMTDLPLIATTVHPASEKTSEVLKPTTVDWYEVKDHWDLTRKHFNETSSPIPFVG